MVVCVIEDKIKVFDLIKNILKANNCTNSMFLYGNADFSADIRKYITENDVLIFRYVNPSLLLTEYNTHFSALIDLAVVGDCGKFRRGAGFDIARLGNTKSLLLNIENSGGVKYSDDNNIQVITCGLKEKDTVIFSSINLDEGNVILDLQRSVKNIKGETLEPFEEQIDIPEIVLDAKAEDLILSFTALKLCNMI